MIEIGRSDCVLAENVERQSPKPTPRLSQPGLSQPEFLQSGLHQSDCLIRIQHRIAACRAARLAGLVEEPKHEHVSRIYWQKQRQEKTALKQRTVLIRDVLIELERHVLQSSGAETLQDADR